MKEIVFNKKKYDSYNDNIKYIFVNFDKEKIALQKNYDDYQFQIIIEIFEDFVEKFPNNKLEYKMDKE